LLTLLVFLIFGAVLVPATLSHFSLVTLAYAVLSLTLVRMLPVAVAMMGSGLDARSVAFLGWFGPRGLASILFALVVVEEGRLASGPLLESVVVLTVLLSALLHGATAYPFARRFGRSAGPPKNPDGDETPVELPVRVRHTGN
jgi:NhaP-type Na+/H+ or K+/H+ antiporter